MSQETNGKPVTDQDINGSIITPEQLEELFSNLDKLIGRIDQTLAFNDRTGVKVKNVNLTREDEALIKSVGGLVIYLMGMIETLANKTRL